MGGWVGKTQKDPLPPKLGEFTVERIPRPVTMLAENPWSLCVFVLTFLEKGPAVFKINLFYWQLRFKLSLLSKNGLCG